MKNIDLAAIRANPTEFVAQMARRGFDPKIEDLLEFDRKRRSFLTATQELQHDIKELSRQIGAAMKAGNTEIADGLKYEVAKKKNSQSHLEYGVTVNEEKLNNLLLSYPNILADDVPEGKNESQNLMVRSYRPGMDLPQGKSHWELDLQFGFEVAAKISGARFNMLMGPVARLHRALGQFMLDYNRKRGFLEVIPPTIVKSDALYGTGQLPKFEDDLFGLRGEYDDKVSQYLIPTAEVSLTNIHANEILTDRGIISYTALTECYRAEAGSAGRDTRGLIRQHQFQKVELVTICHPDFSEFEHNRIVETAEGILEALGLPYRRMLLCAGDTGFSSKKTYDLEVWMPGQNTYREISSISNCGEFQARRMNTRYKIDGKIEFAHTLNGSGLAVGRTLAAVLENYQDGDDILIPEILRPYLGNATFMKDL